MGGVTYAFKGQHITDDDGALLAVAGRDLEGRSVRWESGDFLPTQGGIDLSDPAQAARLTKALWQLHKQAGTVAIDTDWIV